METLRKIQKETLGIRNNVTEMKNVFVGHSCSLESGHSQGLNHLARS